MSKCGSHDGKYVTVNGHGGGTIHGPYDDVLDAARRNVGAERDGNDSYGIYKLVYVGEPEVRVVLETEG